MLAVRGDESVCPGFDSLLAIVGMICDDVSTPEGERDGLTVTMQWQIDGVSSTLWTARTQLETIRAELDRHVWDGPDADRFHATWESEVLTHLDAAIRSVAMLSTRVFDD